MTTLAPTFTRDGGMTDETHEKIARWGAEAIDAFDPHPFRGLLAFALNCFNRDYGKIIWASGELTLITGGWSNNEQVISALQQNLVWWGRHWESSTRGGQHVFDRFTAQEIEGIEPPP